MQSHVVHLNGEVHDACAVYVCDAAHELRREPPELIFVRDALIRDDAKPERSCDKLSDAEENLGGGRIGAEE